MHTETNTFDAAQAPVWLWKQWVNIIRMRQAGVYDAFVEAATERVGKLKLGSGLDPHTTLGPLINARAVDRVRARLCCISCCILSGTLAATAHGSARE